MGGSSQAAPPQPQLHRSYLPVASGRPPVPDFTTPNWLEPNALNITNIVGQVPDQIMSSAIVHWSTGLVQYESSRVEKNVVTIRVTFEGRVQPLGNGITVTSIGCLGQPPGLDGLSSLAPPTVLRMWEGSTEVTGLTLRVDRAEGGIRQPIAGGWEKYPSQREAPNLQADGLHVPANRFCAIILDGARPHLTGEFTLARPASPTVRVVGTQQASFQAYIGPGDVGRFTPLRDQLRARFGLRSGAIPLQIPDGANYVMVLYEPSPVDPYDPSPANAERPTGGTVRLAKLNTVSDLSGDLFHSGPFPLRVAWQDVDQRPTAYLPTIAPLDTLTPPEILILPGQPYDPCYVAGNCSPAVLDRLYNASASITLLYLQVAPPSDAARVPARLVGPSWTVDQTAAASDGCPCGWYNAQGQMIGVSP